MKAKVYYRGKKWDIRDVKYGDTMYFGIARNDGKGYDMLFLELENAKARWKQLESEVETK